MKTLAKRLIPQRWMDRVRGSPLPFSWCYSQMGEDMVVNHFFESKASGFFVDIGAHHPIRYSNTFVLYRRGWRGINIDAMPGSMRLFDQLRPRDINIEAAISDVAQTTTFHVFNDPAINGFDVAVSAQRDGKDGFRIVQRIPIPTRTLKSILEAHLPSQQPIDVMSVDVEGFDMQVLRSNDWSRFRPTMLLVEDLSVKGLKDIAQSEMTRFLADQQYEPMANTLHTVFYKNCLRHD